MEVILLEKIRNLGGLGDKVTVKNGYGRNYLLPYQKAVQANPENIAHFEKRRSELEQKAKEVLSEAKTRASAIEQLNISITARASDEGKLYGSVGTHEIAEAIQAKGVEIHKSEISLPEGVLRQTGEYEIHLQLHSDVTSTIHIKIIAE